MKREILDDICRLEESQSATEEQLAEYHRKWDRGDWQAEDENSYFLLEEWIGISGGMIDDLKAELSKASEVVS